MELDEIIDLVMQMGRLVEKQVGDAIDILNDGEAGLVEAVIANDHRVNALEIRIDEECDRIVVLRQPAAVDMRVVMAVVKIVTDLERIGDEAKNIAHIVQRHLPFRHRDMMSSPEIRRSADHAQAMLKQSIDNFARQDIESAIRLIRANQSIGNKSGYIVRPLVMEMMEEPGAISVALDLLFVSKAIERIAEHSINISEHVVYLVRGKDVRHVPPGEIENKLSEG